MILDIPIEILHETINNLDNRSTLRFLSTCTFLYKQEIKCTRLLVSDCYKFEPHCLRWYTQLDKIKPKFDTLLLTTNDLNQYFNICKYQYMYCIHRFKRSKLPLIRIYGFYTDMGLDTLSMITFDNQNNTINVEIIDHNIFRQVIFKPIVFNYMYVYQNEKLLDHINIYNNSEIIKGRHSLYIENNIKVDHTTLNKYHICNKSYFLSCYTEPIIF